MGMKRTIPVVAGLLIYLLIGLIYGWSIFVAPLETEFGWSRAQTSVTFTISMTFFCLGGIASGVIIKKKSPRFILIVSALCLCIGFCAASKIHSLMGLYIAYGVFCGTGVGMAYNVNISTVLKWFPDKAGFISGLLLMGFGCGGMVLGSLASALIQMMGWRITFVILGILFAVIIIAGSVWIKYPPEDTVFPEVKLKIGTKKENGADMIALQMIRRPSFWIQFLWSILLSAAGLAVIGHASVCAQDLGASVATAALITGTISVCNGVGRVGIGWLFDHMGRRVSVYLANSVMVIANVLLSLSIFFDSLLIFIIAAVILGLSFGAIPAINSAFTNLFYGSRNYPMNFSFMNSNIIFASLLGPLVAGAIQTATGSYLMVFILLLILSALSVFLQLGIKRP